MGGVTRCRAGLGWMMLALVLVSLSASLRSAHALVARRLHAPQGWRCSLSGTRRHRELLGPGAALTLRGGADDEDEEDEEDEDDDDDEEEDEEDDEEEEEDEEDDEDVIEDDGVAEADFEGDSLKARAVKAWSTTPPMTQAYVGASLALTLGARLLNGNVWPEWLYYEWKATFKKLQLWHVQRPVVSRHRRR